MIRTAKNFVHLIIALAANVLYGFPSRSMTVIGVTGTDGKTTTASLIYDILQKSGKKAALLTTVSAVIDGKTYDTGFHVTTPSSVQLQKYFSIAKKKGITHFVLETTSHALDQNRVFGVHYAVSAITNIAPEHLDYHKTYEQYVAAKAKIMKMSDTIVLNAEDMSFSYLKQILGTYTSKPHTVTFALHGKSDVTLDNYPLIVSMPGAFNKYNALAALACVLEVGVSYEEAKKIIKEFQTPRGRQEIVQEKPFTIMVDFAHTPTAFRALLSSIRAEYSGKIIHVFGSAGERDKEKRPDMGKISSVYADTIILTAEDPRTEKVSDINAEIIRGIKSKRHKMVKNKTEKVFDDESVIYQIPDRKEAIQFGISLAKKGDIVVITGKGHEQSMNFGQGEIPWSDHTVIKNIIKKIV